MQMMQACSKTCTASKMPPSRLTLTCSNTHMKVSSCSQRHTRPHSAYFWVKHFHEVFKLMLGIVSWQFHSVLCASFCLWRWSQMFCRSTCLRAETERCHNFMPADDTQLDCLPGELNNQLNHCIADDPLGESVQLLWLPCVHHAVLFTLHLWLMYASCCWTDSFVGLDSSDFVKCDYEANSQRGQVKIPSLVQFADL